MVNLAFYTSIVLIIGQCAWLAWLSLLHHSSTPLHELRILKAIDEKMGISCRVSLSCSLLSPISQDFSLHCWSPHWVLICTPLSALIPSPKDTPISRGYKSALLISALGVDSHTTLRSHPISRGYSHLPRVQVCVVDLHIAPSFACHSPLSTCREYRISFAVLLSSPIFIFVHLPAHLPARTPAFCLTAGPSDVIYSDRKKHMVCT